MAARDRISDELRELKPPRMLKKTYSKTKFLKVFGKHFGDRAKKKRAPKAKKKR